MSKKKIWINNTIEQKMIETDQTIPEGWMPGKLPVSDTTRTKLSESKKGKIHVHLGQISKVINKNELEEYLANGYELGRAKFSEDAINNIITARKQFFEKNPHWTNQTSFNKDQTPWNKGLTAETDIRVKTSVDHYMETRPKGYHYDAITKEKKLQTEKQTRISNAGSLEASYTNAVNKAKKIRKKHSTEDSSFNAQIKKKTEETLIKKYGSLEEFYKLTIENRNKTILEKYNSFEAYYKMLCDKRCKTLQKNGSYIGPKSKKEDDFYFELLKVFDATDIFRWYDEDARYPWHCDFYIKSLDMFIELQLYWTHGTKPFDENSLEDINILNNWLNKRAFYINNKGYETKNQFFTAIETWTVRDVFKRNTAKENNLNYVELFNKEDIYDFITGIQKYHIEDKSTLSK